MKILYITNHLRIAQSNGGFINDYLNDLIFFGLYELLGQNVVDSTPIVSLYKDNKPLIDPRRLWGGFTAFWLIEKDKVDRSDIERKIAYKYFDLIIYGSIRRCNDFYNLVSSAYDPRKIILLDGNDDQQFSPLFRNHFYFKRELIRETDNVFPISFSIPTCKITSQPCKSKNKRLATAIPGLADTYVFTDEASYFKDYNSSYFGITSRKAGWDCMRHYEILANYCLPHFINLEKCPQSTLSIFPKKTLLASKKLFNVPSLEENLYYDVMNQLFEYTKKNLTSKNVAQKLLERIV